MDRLRNAILDAALEEMPFEDSIDNLSDDLNEIVDAFNQYVTAVGPAYLGVKTITDEDLVA